MKRISVKEAEPGMVLARPIVDKQGRTIVNQGATLTQLYISRLEKWGVEELYIETAEAPAAEGAPAPQPAADKPAARPSLAEPPARPSSAKPAPEPQEQGSSLPPGVYHGPDLAERIAATFSRVGHDPLMAALGRVVQRRLAGGR